MTIQQVTLASWKGEQFLAITNVTVERLDCSGLTLQDKNIFLSRFSFCRMHIQGLQIRRGGVAIFEFRLIEFAVINARRFLLLELKASETHNFKKAFAWNESFYKNKYSPEARVLGFWRWFLSKMSDLMFPPGEGDLGAQKKS